MGETELCSAFHLGIIWGKQKVIQSLAVCATEPANCFVFNLGEFGQMEVALAQP